MKKISILSIIILAVSIMTVNAQIIPGARGGLNISNIVKSGDSNFSSDFKVGLHAGLYFDIHIADQFSFEPELMFSQKGYKANGSSILGGAYDYSLTTNFVELPLLLKIKTTGFAIHVGPQFSWLVSTTENFKQGSDAYKNTVRSEFDNLRKNILGGAAGIDIDGQKVGFTARYSLDFQSNNGDGTSQTPEYKNQVIQLGLNLKL